LIFENLTLSNWQQFESIDIDIHKRLTVLTGTNGSGKSTILSILSAFGTYGKLESSHLGIPNAFDKLGNPLYSIPHRNDIKDEFRHKNTIGKVAFKEEKTVIATIFTPNMDSKQACYSLRTSNNYDVPTILIESNRPKFDYKKLDQIKASHIEPDVVLKSMIDPVNKSAHGTDLAASYIKSTLISWAMMGYSNPLREGNSILRGHFEGFQSILKKVLPEELGFERIKVVNTDIVLECKDGLNSFQLESASGGIATIITTSWLIYLFSLITDKEYCILIDEIENHLHPKMQRNILPLLLKAFPKAQFIVSTHSPLVINSVENSNTYALLKSGSDFFTSKKVNFNGHAKTANNILNEALGVSVTYPVWVERKLDEVINRFSKKTADTVSFSDLRSELEALGLAQSFPATIAKIVENIDDQD